MSLDYLSLYKLTSAITLNSGTMPNFRLNYSHIYGGHVISSAVNGTGYVVSDLSTADRLNIYVDTGKATDFALTAATLKQVTAPAATGVMILDGPSGAAGWAEIDSSFDYNDITEITIVPVATIIGATITGATIGNVTP